MDEMEPALDRQSTFGLVHGIKRSGQGHKPRARKRSEPLWSLPILCHTPSLL